MTTRKLSPAAQAKRRVALLPGGIPRWVRCYDNGGESADRFTVCFTGRAATERAPGWAPEYPFRAMSENPCHPQGIGLWQSCRGQPVDTLGEVKNRHYWPPAIGRKVKHLGTRIPFTALPPACRALVLSDYAEVWRL